MGQKQLQDLHVRHEGLSQLSGPPAHGVGRGDPAQLVVQVDAEVADHPEGHVVGEVHLPEVAQGPDEDADDQSGDAAAGAAGQFAVQSQTHQIRRQSGGADDCPLLEEGGDDSQSHLAAVGADGAGEVAHIVMVLPHRLTSSCARIRAR